MLSFPDPPESIHHLQIFFGERKKGGGNRLAIPPKKNSTKTISKDRLLLPRNPTAGLLRFFFRMGKQVLGKGRPFSPNKKRALDYAATDDASVPTIKSVRTQLMSLSPSVYGFGAFPSLITEVRCQQWGDDR